MTTTLTADGLLEIPEVFRKVDALQPGQRCDIERVGRGEYRLRVESSTNAEGPDLVAWLLACPVKDWYVPLEDAQTTDDLKPGLFD